MTEHQKRADELEDEAEDLKARSEELGDEISDVREDWEAKRRDDSVPGAPPPDGDEPPQDDEREPWPDE